MKEIITYSPELQRLFNTWRLATESNDTTAQFNLASVLLKSKQNSAVQKAFLLFKKLANQSYTTVQTDAQFMLGKCYENGYGIQKSYPRAIRWYEKAGNNAGYDMAPICEAFDKMVDENGSNVDKTIDEIVFGEITLELIDCITESANGGDVEAQMYLMDLYNLGCGYIEPNHEKFIYWTQRAAENGSPKAMDKLGHIYYYGYSVEQDDKTALYWLENAAIQGEENSAHLLGLHYKSQKNYKEAVKWYRKYAELKIKWRNNMLGRNSGVILNK